MLEPDSERQNQTRETLRSLGVVVTGIGVVFTAIGLISFFSAFGSFGPPRYFWCAFIGLPLIGLGSNLMRYGYMGAVGRYVAGEVAPVAKDTINYLADGTEDTIAKVSRAVGEGLSRAGQAGATQIVRCHKCNHDNPADAKFCNGCGAALQKNKPCPDCGELNDPDAKFCDNCGRLFE